jgi:hypothetical protein
MVLSNLDLRLLEVGFNELTLFEKNQLIVAIASKKGIPYINVTEQVVLDYHKEIKIFILNEICEDSIIDGFVSSNGHKYRTNRDDQMNMLGQKDYLLSDTSIATVMWKTEDVGYVEHTRQDWLSIYLEAFAHKQAQLYKYNTLKLQVVSATTHEDITVIQWNPPVVEEPVVDPME